MKGTKETIYQIPKSDKPVICAGMNSRRYDMAEHYFINTGLIFSNNGGKTFKRTIHILRPQCAAWAEFAFGNHEINTVTNVLYWREQELAQRELDNLWKLA